MGIIVTLSSGAFSAAFPQTSNYVFLPGMMVVYIASGGVHGYASGVYLPSLPLWYTLGAVVNVLVYSGLAFLILAVLGIKKNRNAV